MLELDGRKVLVLGLGDTGLSMARWLAARGARVTVADTRTAPPQAAALARALPQAVLECGAIRESSLRDAELIAISPGVDRRTPEIAAAIKRGTPVAGDVELFAQVLPQFKSKPQVIAITGTNGKSTVTQMAGDMCAAAGRRTVVAGNIGTPVLDALDDAARSGVTPDVFVLELSSFQLESTASLHADAATMLNLSEDHLDRYDGIDDYARAKQRVFNGDGAQILNRSDARSLAMAQVGRVVQRFGSDAPQGANEWGIGDSAGTAALMRDADVLLPLAELPVAGLHNAANALAAAALCHAIGIDDKAIASALRAFKGLPHRVEQVGTLDGVVYYDDSKGTNVGSTVAALGGFTQPVVLIAGGEGKGQDFAPLREPVKQRARAVILIGRDAPLIGAALDGCGVPCLRATDMNDAVAQARAQAQCGDAVLLSPACASFDMFRNYNHRGEVFAAAVQKLVSHEQH
jgi:UDP-N-acetylmuramoylalanine--D-glutamate ligase